MDFSNRHRQQFIREASSREYDLLVIGGGITGCGIALDAGLRGMQTILLERHDFACGTSSRSTKLIHGGLRYLKQLQWKLVRDVGRERAVVYRNAMHIVRPEKMLLPVVRNGSLSRLSTALALSVYDFLAGVKKEERRKMLSAPAALQQEPLLDADRLLGGSLYFEYRCDDARLVTELAKSAHREGARLLNYAEVKGFIYSDQGRVIGVKATDRLSGTEFEVKAKQVVNASGPWVDACRRMDKSFDGERLILSRGIHLVFPQSLFPVRQAVYFDTDDGRMIFAIPRQQVVYVGTTDTFYSGDLQEPPVTKEDVNYILSAVKTMFPQVSLQEKDILSSWSGLRPLIQEKGKVAGEISRKDEIMESPSGLLSIAGGKLTGYRLMAEKIVNKVAAREPGRFGPCKTKTYRLSGGDFQSAAHMEDYRTMFRERYGAAEWLIPFIDEWFFRYGTHTEWIIENALGLEQLIADPFHRCVMAELIYSFDHEMTATVSDFLVRRTGMLYFERRKALAVCDEIHEYLQKNLSYPSPLNQSFRQEIHLLLKQAVDFT